ncbi:MULTISPECIES: hypothetical protein [Methanobacterium]|jgi:hypothetical protein|nr:MULTISPECIES: hypothetical protein [Methanobacterium]MCZ3365022.1 hypothetical protein [Methanobacterium veterum]MCZ3372777.1 hypothetical protein [Methanobacterium veterum]
MTQYLGWRSIFFLNVLLGVIVISFVILRLKGEWAECMGEKFDLKSAVVYSFTLLLLMYGFSSLPGTLGIILTVMGIIGIIVFILVDTKVDNPLLDMDLF